DVLGAAEADEPRQPLRPARAGDHPEPDLRQPELGVVGGDAEVAGERELEPDAEAVAAQAGDDGLREALRRGDVPGEARELLRRRVQERGDVAAGGEVLAGTSEDDGADAVVARQLREQRGELPAR